MPVGGAVSSEQTHRDPGEIWPGEQGFLVGEVVPTDSNTVFGVVVSILEPTDAMVERKWQAKSEYWPERALPDSFHVVPIDDPQSWLEANDRTGVRLPLSEFGPPSQFIPAPEGRAYGVSVHNDRSDERPGRAVAWFFDLGTEKMRAWGAKHLNDTYIRLGSDQFLWFTETTLMPIEPVRPTVPVRGNSPGENPGS